MQTRLNRKLMEVGIWTQDLTTSDGFERTLKAIRLAMAYAKVNEAVVNQVMEQLGAPTLKSKVLAEKEPAMRMAALWTGIHEALELFGEKDEVVKEWLDEYRYVHVKTAPPSTVLPPYHGEDPRLAN